MYELQDILILLLFAALVLWWWRLSGQKAQALRVARRQCERRGLQLLDQTLAFARYRLEKDGRGRTWLCRHYDFDFCRNGLDRHKGTIVMAGMTSLRVMLEDNHTEIIQY